MASVQNEMSEREIRKLRREIILAEEEIRRETESEIRKINEQREIRELQCAQRRRNALEREVNSRKPDGDGLPLSDDIYNSDSKS